MSRWWLLPAALAIWGSCGFLAAAIVGRKGGHRREWFVRGFIGGIAVVIRAMRWDAKDDTGTSAAEGSSTLRGRLRRNWAVQRHSARGWASGGVLCAVVAALYVALRPPVVLIAVGVFAFGGVAAVCFMQCWRRRKLPR
jgi:hypothetical protein